MGKTSHTCGACAAAAARSAGTRHCRSTEAYGVWYRDEVSRTGALQCPDESLDALEVGAPRYHLGLAPPQ